MQQQMGRAKRVRINNTSSDQLPNWQGTRHHKRALVLAHSLRDAGTTKKLAALFTTDSVSTEAIYELLSVYDYVIPVPRIRNAHPENLQLMNRTDLHSAFTKIALWNQTRFRKIVYIDADVVAYRAPDELFNIAHHFSATPDIGWPDLFNTGVMVLSPNVGDYYAMMAMADRGISFDGADQGLINTHFRNNYNRLSFTYNVTPSAHYQYVPAYRHFQSTINMVHFIGPDKPWFRGRHASTGSYPFDEMTGRWWAVYDRHYRAASCKSASVATTQPIATVVPAQPVSEVVQYYTKGEYQPMGSHINPPPSKRYSGDHHDGEYHGYHITAHNQEQYHPVDLHTTHHHPDASSIKIGSQEIHHRRDAQGHEAPVSEASTQQVEHAGSAPGDEQVYTEGLSVVPLDSRQAQPPSQPLMSSWDPQKHPPPTESKPEALNFPATVYEMSKSTAPFIAPRQYPKPPKDMWYEVPREAPAPPSEPPKPIFPWEAHQPKPSRVFVEEKPEASQDSGAHIVGTPPSEVLKVQSSNESLLAEASPVEQKSEPATPAQIMTLDPWTSYSRTNAWDEVPGIERYVDSIHQKQRPKKAPGTITLPGPGEGVEDTTRQRRGSKLTDFPSEVERPSLPVTPAPIRRENFWDPESISSHNDKNPLLPFAVGVPGQRDWDPAVQLQKLAQQGEDLLQKLDGCGRQGSSDLPPRSLPSGSTGLGSPTYVARPAQVLSPQPVKGSASSSSVLGLMADLEVTPRAASSLARQDVSDIPAPTSEEPVSKEAGIL
ncbi:putative glycosyl transferase family 8 [Rosellinia necatrix]|uniref:glycogenin glucosyltransferase n=1 Tax=Rosellinia necatrix TaxID=77044 RepID=A0A1W2THK3_ROSNE|nr:putative glycosyl transferase family 8 [Rosellinia necatrix]